MLLCGKHFFAVVSTEATALPNLPFCISTNVPLLSDVLDLHGLALDKCKCILEREREWDKQRKMDTHKVTLQFYAILLMQFCFVSRH